MASILFMIVYYYHSWFQGSFKTLGEIPCPNFPQALWLETTDLLSLIITVPVQDFPYKWNGTLCAPFRLASFKEHVFKVHPGSTCLNIFVQTHAFIYLEYNLRDAISMSPALCSPLGTTKWPPSVPVPLFVLTVLYETHPRQ